MEQAIAKVSFDELIMGIEEEYGGRYLNADVTTREELKLHDTVHIAVSFDEFDKFYIVFDNYDEKIINIAAAYEVHKMPALERYGNLVISHELE